MGLVCNHISSSSYLSPALLPACLSYVWALTELVFFHAGILMSTGGSKLRWCAYYPFLSAPSMLIINKQTNRAGSDGCHHRLSRFPWIHLHGILISLQIAAGVIIAWGRTIYGQFELLAGKSAPHDFLQLVIYKATTFSEEISKLDTVRAYHVRRLYYSPEQLFVYWCILYCRADRLVLFLNAI